MSEQIAKMRERRAFFSAIAGKYASSEAFVRENGHWLDMVGIELIESECCLKLCIRLEYSDYEEYYIMPGGCGFLTVSPVVGFQDDCCANRLINIDTGEDAGEDDISECGKFHT